MDDLPTPNATLAIPEGFSRAVLHMCRPTTQWRDKSYIGLKAASHLHTYSPVFLARMYSYTGFLSSTAWRRSSGQTNSGFLSDALRTLVECSASLRSYG